MIVLKGLGIGKLYSLPGKGRIAIPSLVSFHFLNPSNDLFMAYPDLLRERHLSPFCAEIKGLNPFVGPLLVLLRLYWSILLCSGQGLKIDDL